MTKFLTDNLPYIGFSIGVVLALYGFFGIVGLYVLGTVIAVVGLFAFLGWVNHLTGGAVAAVLLFWSL